MIVLGSLVKDKVSGYQGIAMSRTTFLNGCIRISVQGPLGKDGKWTEDRWFDEQQIEFVGSGIIPEAKEIKGVLKPMAAVGGPQDSEVPMSISVQGGDR